MRMARPRVAAVHVAENGNCTLDASQARVCTLAHVRRGRLGAGYADTDIDVRTGGFG
jgi:hypothetical protein